MAARFHNITQQEIQGFMAHQGFVLMNPKSFLPLTVVELVYGKVGTIKINNKNHKISLRIYTGINPSGESRKKGSDAINLRLYWRAVDTATQQPLNIPPVQVGKTHKCLRVTNWEKNLEKAIKEIIAESIPHCPVCNSLMVLRSGAKGDFWGCSLFHHSKCNGTRNHEIRSH